MERDDLTSKQKDYAIFLPAISGFFATYVGKQRAEGFVPPERMPAGIPEMEDLNWLNPNSLFPYQWSLYSAGHANLDLTTPDSGEDMVRDRDPSAIIVGDSGGFQIAKGVWEGIWAAPDSVGVQQALAECARRGTETRPVLVKVKKLDPNGEEILDKNKPVYEMVQAMDRNGNPKTVTVDLVREYKSKLAMAQKKREQVLAWMDGVMNYGMVLDTPAWVADTPVGPTIGIHRYEDAVAATQYNNEYFITNRRGVEAGGVRFLNVLQGSTQDQAMHWYATMKDYCDPAKYPGRHFNGWAMGGQTKSDVHLMMRLLNAIRWDGLMEQGRQDWLHVLGTSKLEYALLLTNIQRSIRRYVNPDFTISFDCASPFLATANGQIYHHADMRNDNRWTYRMSKSIDDKKYAVDQRSLRDVALQDFPDHFKHFDDGPVSERLKISDICVYRPGIRKSDAELGGEKFDADCDDHYHQVPDRNKINKVGRTSWDSFSYALQMAHNVWTHIHAVQESNRLYDTGRRPNSMRWSKSDFAVVTRPGNCEDVIDSIFAAPDRATAEEIIEYYSDYWTEIVGTHGYTGKRVINANSRFNALFNFDDDQTEDDASDGGGDDQEFDEGKLDELS